jgi:hypothetical protein
MIQHEITHGDRDVCELREERFQRSVINIASVIVRSGLPYPPEGDVMIYLFLGLLI